MATYHLSIGDGKTVSSDELLKQLEPLIESNPEAKRVHTGLSGICAFGIAYTNQDFDLMSAARRIIREVNEPPPGSWASVARIMASMPTDPDEPPIDWDAWKDEMKDRELMEGDRD